MEVKRVGRNKGYRETCFTLSWYGERKHELARYPRIATHLLGLRSLFPEISLFDPKGLSFMGLLLPRVSAPDRILRCFTRTPFAY